MTTYLIKPKYKKSSYSNEYWTNSIENKEVTLIVTIQWRWSSYSINLTDEQKKIVEESDNLLLSDYDYEFIDNDDGCERFLVIENENNYTARELKAIYKTIYEDDDEIYDENFMEENGWDIDDTTYEINGGIELEEIN